MAYKTKKLLKEKNIKPKKGLGQNFLIDEKAIRRIILASDIKPDNLIVEIGPGTGNLTKQIAQKAKKVIAVEKDKGIIETLKESLKDFDNIEIINEDILEFDIKLKDAYKIVANIPFYITAALIRQFLESDFPPIDMTLIVQKEVAQRICKNPPDMNILAASMQFYASPKIISYISKNCFYPAPKVDSAIIKITPYKNEYNRNKEFREKFFHVVHAAYSQPRKQLINNLSKGLKISKEKAKGLIVKNNLKPEQRAETLSVEDLINLSK